MRSITFCFGILIFSSFAVQVRSNNTIENCFQLPDVRKSEVNLKKIDIIEYIVCKEYYKYHHSRGVQFNTNHKQLVSRTHNLKSH